MPAETLTAEQVRALAKPPRGKPEGALLKRCRQVLNLRNLEHWRCNTGAVQIGKRFVRFGEPGAADLQVLLPPVGRALFVETKAGRNDQTADQKAFQARVERPGALYWLIRDDRDLEKRLDELAKERK